MSSILKVDTIQSTAGAAPTTKDLGFAAGSVIQTQVARFSGGSASMSTSSYTSSGRSVTITPRFANSLILIRYTATSYVNSGTYGYFTFYRGSTNLYNQSGYSTNPSTQALIQLGSITGDAYFPSTGEFADSSHNSTSALTYTLYGKRGSGSGSVYWPPGSSDGATFTATEIAQ